MMWTLAVFLGQSFAISLSGALSPGPVTTATLAAGTHRRHAGIWIAVGHAMVEGPVMLLILAGAGVVMKSLGFRIGVGLAGGAVLLLLATLMLLSLRNPDAEPGKNHAASPIWTGIALSAGNPYFLVWWATVGLAITSRAVELGILAFGLFVIIHWACDVFCLEFLSVASHKGARWLGRSGQRIILIICAGAMAVFGAWFIWDAAAMIRA